MRYAILRTAKIKSAPGLVRALKHDLREHTPPNADPDLAAANDLRGSWQEGMKKFRDLTKEVRKRKDSVVGIEYLVTASPEAMALKTKAQQDAYFRDALKWILDRHGKENLLSVGIHRDEKTPHLHAVVVPLVRSKDRWGKIGKSLAAKTWLGGNKLLSQMQTDFALKVGQKHGLERGLEGSRAKHKTIREFYKALDSENRILANYELPKRGKPEEVEKIILEGLKAGLGALQVKALTAEADRATRANLSKAFNEDQEKIRALEKKLLELPLEKIQELRDKAQEVQVQRKSRTKNQSLEQ